MAKRPAVFGRKALPRESPAIPRLLKTKLCSFFQEGRCRRGDACAFAHSVSELELPPDLLKTSICTRWKEGVCPFTADVCRFAHGKRDLRNLPDVVDGRAKWYNDDCLLATKPPVLQQEISPTAWLAMGLQELSTRSECEALEECDISSLNLSPKVINPSQQQNLGCMATMEVNTSEDSLFARWGRWDSETAVGESSSEDDGSRPSTSIQSIAGSKHIVPTHSNYSGTSMMHTKSSQAESDSIMPGMFDLSILADGAEPPADNAINAEVGSYSDKRGFGCPLSETTAMYPPPPQAEFDNQAFDAYSPFGGMPRLW